MSENNVTAPPPPAGGETSKKSSGFVYPGLTLPFALLVCCFAAWGMATDLTAPMVNVFKQVFDMNTVQAALVQFAYYGAYFLLAIPAAFINSKLGYKGGVVIGLVLAASGALLFFPASKIMTYGMFLAALFVMAGGLSILETSANPFVMSLGPEHNATRRLNFAQAFNPIGSNLGVLISTLAIAPFITDAVHKQNMSEAERLATASTELGHVMVPYICLGLLYLCLGLALFMVKIPKTNARMSETDATGYRKGVFGRLLHNKVYVFGVIAQFFNIAAQTCIWTFIVFYVKFTLHIDNKEAGWWLQIALLFFLVMRFVMVWLMGRFDGRKMMVFMCGLGIVFTTIGILSGTIVGALCIAALSGCIPLLFPTIYGVALTGLKEDTKFGSSGLVMAIVGGALMPMVQARIQDLTNPQVGFIVVLLCFVIVGSYGLFAVKNQVMTQD